MRQPALFDTGPLMRIPTDTWVLPRPRPDSDVGGFPLHFERRLWEVLGKPEKVLHPFGGLCEIGDSVDLNVTTAPTWVGDAHDPERGCAATLRPRSEHAHE